jgi:hypothetical protein
VIPNSSCRGRFSSTSSRAPPPGRASGRASHAGHLPAILLGSRASSRQGSRVGHRSSGATPPAGSAPGPTGRRAEPPRSGGRAPLPSRASERLRAARARNQPASSCSHRLRAARAERIRQCRGPALGGALATSSPRSVEHPAVLARAPGSPRPTLPWPGAAVAGVHARDCLALGPRPLR